MAFKNGNRTNEPGSDEYTRNRENADVSRYRATKRRRYTACACTVHTVKCQAKKTGDFESLEKLYAPS